MSYPVRGHDSGNVLNDVSLDTPGLKSYRAKNRMSASEALNSLHILIRCQNDLPKESAQEHSPAVYDADGRSDSG